MADSARFDELRQQIEAVTQQIVALLDERFELVDQLGHQKRGLSRPVRDYPREAALLDRLVAASSGAIPEPALRKICQAIMDESVAYMQDQSRASEGA